MTKVQGLLIARAHAPIPGLSCGLAWNGVGDLCLVVEVGLLAFSFWLVLLPKARICCTGQQILLTAKSYHSCSAAKYL